MSTGGLESGLPLIPLTDTHKVVRVPEVQLGEDGSTDEGFEVGAHEGERVFVLDSDVVELPVVYARPQIPTLLLDEKEPCCHRRCGRAYKTLSQTIINVTVHSRPLR